MPTTDTKTDYAIAIRDLTHRDFNPILQIEQLNGVNPWSRDDLQKVLISKTRGLTRCGIVAISGKRHIVGYAVMEATPKSCQILNIAVHPKFRRKGVGRKMLAWIEDSLTKSERDRIGIEVREHNLPVQLFLRACRYTAIDSIREYYDDTGEDAIRFEKLVRHRSEPASEPAT